MNFCAPMVFKRRLFTTHIGSLLLGASFNTIFAMCVTSLLLGASFDTKLLLQNFILDHYSYNTKDCTSQIPKTCYCALATIKQKNLQICIVTPLLEHIFVKRNVHKKGCSCCTFSSTITIIMEVQVNLSTRF